MSIANLKLDARAKLGFEVSVTGAAGQPKASFIIEKDEGMAFVFPCKSTNEGVEVEISELKGMLPPGEYKVRLEVVVENKMYTPLEDTITFEPLVEVASKINVTPKIVESVKISGEIKVESVISENILRKTQAATIIATSLNYKPLENETPKEIIEHAIESVTEMSEEQIQTLKEMLKLAESVGIEISPQP